MFGKRAASHEASRAVMSSSTWSLPVARICTSSACATMLRGASSARGWTAGMKRSPLTS